MVKGCSHLHPWFGKCQLASSHPSPAPSSTLLPIAFCYLTWWDSCRSSFSSLNQKNKSQRLSSCQITELNQPVDGGGISSEDKQGKKKEEWWKNSFIFPAPRFGPWALKSQSLGCLQSEQEKCMSYRTSEEKVASNQALLTPTRATCRIRNTEPQCLLHWGNRSFPVGCESSPSVAHFPIILPGKLGHRFQACDFYSRKSCLNISPSSDPFSEESSPLPACLQCVSSPTLILLAHSKCPVIPTQHPPLQWCSLMGYMHTWP